MVDGTSVYEVDLFVSKDGAALTGFCGDPDPGCDPVFNTFAIQVNSLSEFALAALNIPTIRSLSAPLEPVSVYTLVEVSASFSNPGVNDTGCLGMGGRRPPPKVKLLVELSLEAMTIQIPVCIQSHSKLLMAKVNRTG